MKKQKKIQIQNRDGGVRNNRPEFGRNVLSSPVECPQNFITPC
jgi:hypothetical protein